MAETDRHSTTDTHFLLLHVEDDADDAVLIGRGLQKCGVATRVLVVENGEEATRYLSGAEPFEDRNEFPLPDLVLLDLNTPVMNGHEFLEWRRQRPEFQGVPVVVLTSSSSRTDISAAYGAGANGYLTKPLAHHEMVAMLSDLGRFWLNWNRTPHSS